MVHLTSALYINLLPYGNNLDIRCCYSYVATILAPHTSPPVVKKLSQNGLFGPAVFKTPSIIISPRARPRCCLASFRSQTPPTSQPNSPSQSTTILLVVVEESHVITHETTIGTAEEEDDVSISQSKPAEDVESSSSVTSSSVIKCRHGCAAPNFHILASTPSRSAISASNRQKVMGRPSMYLNFLLLQHPHLHTQHHVTPYPHYLLWDFLSPPVLSHLRILLCLVFQLSRLQRSRSV
jgi:hypothetical protein